MLSKSVRSIEYWSCTGNVIWAPFKGRGFDTVRANEHMLCTNNYMALFKGRQLPEAT